MTTLDNAFTCHGQSWSGECRVCIDIENAFNRGHDQGWVTEYEKEYEND